MHNFKTLKYLAKENPVFVLIEFSCTNLISHKMHIATYKMDGHEYKVTQ